MDKDVGRAFKQADLQLDAILSATISHEALERIVREAAASKTESSNYRILDWGCGRGGDVVQLRKLGFTAFGVDVSADFVENSDQLFQRTLGYDRGTLSVIDEHGSTIFPDAFFDAATSYYVFEHISDMELVASELSRLMKPGGQVIAIYPGHLSLIEGHLHMPFVHWFPKGSLRKVAIRLFTTLGFGPNWNLNGTSAKERANAYFKYSVNNTFYRSQRTMDKFFRNHGFLINDETYLHHRLRAARRYWHLPGSVLNAVAGTFFSRLVVYRKI